MKILLVSEYFFPASSGGTEQYVHQLAKSLRSLGEIVYILTADHNVGNYKFDEFEVHCIPFNLDNAKGVIAGLAPPGNLQYFAAKINELKPEVIHFHTLTTTLGIYHFRQAVKTGAKIFFTSHIPGNTCIRGNLMRYGKTVCDGKIRLNTCLACYLNGRGVPEKTSPALASLMLISGYPRPLSQTSRLKQIQLKELSEICDGIVVMSEWQMNTFLINGIPVKKMILSRHPFEVTERVRPAADSSNRIRIGFAGRVSEEKGLDHLINALKDLDVNKFSLHIAAIKPPRNTGHFEKLREQTQAVENIFWHFGFRQHNMTEFYDQIDALCIPSNMLETGPYVMFEAVGLNIPVIASDSGNMREWSDLGYPITVFPVADVKKLKEILEEFPNSISPTTICPPLRSYQEIARQMMLIYENR